MQGGTLYGTPLYKRSGGNTFSKLNFQVEPFCMWLVSKTMISAP